MTEPTPTTLAVEFVPPGADGVPAKDRRAHSLLTKTQNIVLV